MEANNYEENLIDALKNAAKAGSAELCAGFNPAKKANNRTHSKEASLSLEKTVEGKFRETILKDFSDISIMGEEGSDTKGSSDYTVIVDPLDGTGDFANGNPFFAFCVALAKAGEVVWGYVDAPKLGMVWEARLGNGAYCNGHSIEVSRINDLAKSYVVWCEGGCDNKKRLLDIYEAIYPRVTDLRKLGAASIEGCFVAMGKVEAYVTTSLEVWDVAAAALIVKEAGGSVTDFCGNMWEMTQHDLIFSNGLLHENIVSLVRSK